VGSSRSTSLGRGEPAARDRHGLALAARDSAHEGLGPRLRFELGEGLAGAARVGCAGADSPDRAPHGV
jgi:hypothetical protein